MHQDTFFISATTSRKNFITVSSHPVHTAASVGLLRFFVNRVLFAEFAVLIELQTIRVVLLVFVGTVVAAVALRALQRDIVAHFLITPLTFADYDSPSVSKMSLIQFSTPVPSCQQENLDNTGFFEGFSCRF